MILQLLFRIILLSWPMIARAQELPLAKSNCSSKCGTVTIPFPFGIGEGCYIDPWFDIECNSSGKPFIKSINLEVLNISLEGTMRVNHPVLKSCSPHDGYVSSLYGDLHAGSPFVFSQESNKFIGLGCNNIAYMTNMTNSSESMIGGCFSFCDKETRKENDNCYGIKCCQSPIPSFLKEFNATLQDMYFGGGNDKECKYAFLVEQNWFQANLTNPQDVKTKNMSHVPVVLDWGIFNSSFHKLEENQSTSIYMHSYSCEEDDEHFTSFCANSSIFRCQCNPCKKGNPYLLQGCEDIADECFPRGPKLKENNQNMVVLGCSAGLASFFLVFGAWWLCIIIKKRKAIKLKQKFFKQNGGLFLQRQLTSSDGSVDSSKLFNSKELDKATDHFNVNRILGEGGQGTVYKGMLSDGRIVAVKKPKVVDEGKVHEFINEVVILSQINHRNVVKLLGCCLETEVPLLVYEFIPNGTLFQYLHHQNEEVSLTWNMRLRIAVEVAGALSYLHSAASLPIYHRDIKSTNILLDEKYRAKVADFGTSRSIAIDQTHVTTKVQGTFGYLDPEFFQSSQFTDKSDVYSFGVVLVELLTGQKPISSTRSGEKKNLVTSFIFSVEENCLYDILDAHVQKQGKKEDIMAIANLAKRCLNLNGKNRPTMKEVAMVLEGIQASQKDDGLQQTYQEIEFERTEVFEACDVGSSSTSTLEHVGSSI